MMTSMSVVQNNSKNLNFGTKLKFTTFDDLCFKISDFKHANPELTTDSPSYTLGVGPCIDVIVRDMNSDKHNHHHRMYNGFPDKIIKFLSSDSLGQKALTKKAMEFVDSDKLKVFIIGGWDIDGGRKFAKHIINSFKKEPSVKEMTVLSTAGNRKFSDSVAFIPKEDTLLISAQTTDDAKHFFPKNEKDLKGYYRNVILSASDYIEQ